MADKAKYNEILKQVRTLDAPEKLSLIETIVHWLQAERTDQPMTKLSSLAGLGSEIWKDVDIDKYIEDLRQW